MNRGHSDRNLLLGMLAVQFRFVTQPALIKAMHGWMLEQHRPLEDILTEQGALNSNKRAELLQVFATFIEQHGGDVEQSLGSLAPQPELIQELQSLGGEDLQGSVMALAPQPVKSPPKVSNPIHDLLSDDSTEPVGESVDQESRSQRAAHFRFEKSEFYKQGGLGIVFKANDTELSRNVALKEIRPERSQDPQFQNRFLREGRITGTLEHPGVVPVYSLGKYPDGRPYYAMRFIRGKSLKQAIQEFHASNAVEAVGPKSVASQQQEADMVAASKTDDNDTQKDSEGLKFDSLEKLIRRFISVCETIAYAHSRGVLHRDLKPENIMLGKFGETYVVDWGLAKAQDEAEPIFDGEYSIDPPVTPHAHENVNTKGPFGTPGYMSPEQEAGDASKVSFSTDIYALGATLYVILTNKTPSIIQSEPKSDIELPTQLNSNAPRNLEFICLKALQKHPENRFASAKDFANALQCAIDGLPIEGWNNEPLVDRAVRLTKQHKTGVVSAVAATLVAAITFSVMFVVVSGQKSEIDKALQKVTEANSTVEQQRLSAIKSLVARHEEGFAERLTAGRKAEATAWAIAAARYERDHPDWPSREAIHRKRISMLVREFAPLQQFINLGGNLAFASISEDKNRLVTIHTTLSGHVIQTWDTATANVIGQPITLRNFAHTNVVTMNRSGERLAIALVDPAAAATVIQCYDLTKGLMIGKEIKPGRLVRAITLDPSGQWVMAELSGAPSGLAGLFGSNADSVKFWNIETGKPHGTELKENDYIASALWFDSDHVFIRDKKIGADKKTERQTQLFEITTGKVVTPEWLKEYPENPLTWFAISRDTQRMALSTTLTTTGRVTVVERVSGQKLAAFDHRGVACELHFLDPEGTLIAVISQEVADANRKGREFLQVFQVSQQKLLMEQVFDHPVTHFSVAPESLWTLIGTSNGDLSIGAWLPGHSPLPTQHYERAVRCAAVTRDHKHLVVVTDDGKIRITDLTRNGLDEERVVPSFIHDDFARAPFRPQWYPSEDSHELSFGLHRVPLARSANGEWVLVKQTVDGSSEETPNLTSPAYRQAALWNLKTKQLLRKWDHTHDIEAGWLSPDGRHVAFATRQQIAIRPWNPVGAARHPSSLPRVDDKIDFDRPAARDPQPRLWLCDIHQTDSPTVELSHAGLILELMFLPKQSRFVVVAAKENGGGILQLHDLMSGEAIAKPLETIVAPIEVMRARDTDRFLIRGSDNSYFITDVTNDELVPVGDLGSQINIGYRCPSLSADGETVFVASWGTSTELEARSISGSTVWKKVFPSEQVAWVRLNVPRNELLVTTQEGMLYVLDAKSSRLKRSKQLNNESNTTEVSPDGQLFATLTTTGVPQFWDSATLLPISGPQAPALPRELTTYAVHFDDTADTAFVFRMGNVASELIRLDGPVRDWKKLDGLGLLAAQHQLFGSSTGVVGDEFIVSRTLAADLELAKQLGARQPNHWPSQLSYARSLRALEKLDEAATVLEDSLQRNADRPVALLFELAEMYGQAKKRKDEVPLRREILLQTVETGDIAALVKQVDLLRLAAPRECLNAIQILRKRMGQRKDAETQQLHFDLGMAEIVANDAIGDFVAMEARFKIQKTDPFTQLFLRLPALRASMNAIQSRIDLGLNRREAFRALTAQMVQDLSPEPAALELVRTLVTAHSVPDALEDWSVVLPHFERLAPHQKTYFDLMALHGCALYRSGKFQEAIPVLEAAIELGQMSPTDFFDREGPLLPKMTPMAFLSMCYQKTGQLEKARHWLQQTEESQAADFKAADDAGSATLITASRRAHMERLIREASDFLN